MLSSGPPGRALSWSEFKPLLNYRPSPGAGDLGFGIWNFGPMELRNQEFLDCGTKELGMSGGRDGLVGFWVATLPIAAIGT